MKRLLRIGGLAALVAGLVVGVVPASHATQSVTYTFAVPCNSGANVTAPVTFPSGVYEVVVTGACSLVNGVAGTGVSTPCNTPVGAIPCTTLTLNNLPYAECWSVALGYDVEPCGGWLDVTPARCAYSIAVWSSTGSACMPSAVNTYVHPGGPMWVTYSDTAYSDNTGAFLVTVIWTPQ